MKARAPFLAGGHHERVEVLPHIAAIRSRITDSSLALSLYLGLMTALILSAVSCDETDENATEDSILART